MLIFLFLPYALWAKNESVDKVNPKGSGFVENKGQIIDQNYQPNPSVLYMLNTPGMNIQLRRNGFSYDVYHYMDTDNGLPEIKFHRIDFDIIDPNPDFKIVASGVNDDFLNYYTAGTTQSGITNVKTFTKVTYKNIYQNIDLEFISDSEKGFKYNFIICPGGSIASIKIRITDPEITIGAKGSLLIHNSVATVEECIPESFYFDHETKIPVKIVFKKTKPNEFILVSETNIPVNTGIIIDPIPTRIWGTYYGGNGDDIFGFCTTDLQGNIYLSGQTGSANNIATSGAHQIVLGSNDGDAFLIKFDSGGQRLWGTYYGGNSNDVGHCCHVDNLGYVYLAGQTSSDNNISTPGVHQPALIAGSPAGFLAKFNSIGQRIWGTYYGGTNGTTITSVTTDDSAFVYIAGNTESTFNISTSGTQQPTYSALGDCFLVRFDSSGQRLWGTYYGGNMPDDCAGVSTNGSDLICLTGFTSSTFNIASTGAFQTNFNGEWDAFLTTFNFNGQRVWGTYYGESAVDKGNSCAFDGKGGIYFVGETSCTNGISTPGIHQPTFGGGNYDGFLAKFNIIGQRIWCTYYGGDSTDILNGLSIGDSGNVYVTGRTQSTINIASNGAFQLTNNGNSDAFIAKINPDGQRIWGTYYGGPGYDIANNISLDTAETIPKIYIAGLTTSTDSVSTSGSHQPIFGGGNYDDFLIRFDNCTIPNSAGIITGPAEVCQVSSGITYSVPSIGNASGYIWNLPTGVTITSGLNTNTITTEFTSLATSGDIVVRGNNACGTGDSSFIQVTVHSRPMPIISGNDTTCVGESSYFTSSGKSQYQWVVSSGGTITGGGTTVDTSLTVLWNVPGLQWVSINYIDTNGCAGLNPTVKNIEVSIGIPVDVTISATQNTICQGTSVTFTATPINGGTNPVYQWKVNSLNAGTNSPVFTYSPINGDVVQCILTSSNTVCTSNNPASSNTISMVVYPNLPVSVSVSPSQNPVCAGTSVTFTATSTNGGTIPSYQWKVNGINVGTNNPSYSYPPLNNDIVTCILTSSETCTSGNPASSNIVTMTVNPLLPVSITISPSSNPFCIGNSVSFTATPTNGGTNPSYQWKVNGVIVGTNIPTYAYNPVSGDVVTCTLTSSELCTSSNPASSNPVSMIGTVGLPAGISITASPNPFCPGSPVTCIATPSNGGNNPVYQWKVNGVNAGTNSPNYSFNPLNNDSVRCVMTSNLSCVSNNPAGSNKISLSGTLAPVVTFTSCFDTITTLNAKPIKLKGGIPLNGTYSGPGVNSTTGVFTPSMAGIGLKTITYSYTNVSLCSASKNKTILVLSTPSFTCGNNLTDIRDNKVYPTVQIGLQCWMATNLNHGIIINSPQLQYDNCISEKYCYNNLNSNCSSYGGLFRWDELMQYDGSPANQGLCPPGWHIPTEGEWTTLFNFYSGSAFAGKPLQDSIIAGFRALTGGVFYMSMSWNFNGFATLFWSSTSWGATKALSHGMNTYNYSVSLYPSSRANAFPARCLKD